MVIEANWHNQYPDNPWSDTWALHKDDQQDRALFSPDWLTGKKQTGYKAVFSAGSKYIRSPLWATLCTK